MCQGYRSDRSETAETASTVRKPGCTGTCERCPLNADAVARVLETLTAPEMLSPTPSGLANH